MFAFNKYEIDPKVLNTISTIKQLIIGNELITIYKICIS